MKGFKKTLFFAVLFILALTISVSALAETGVYNTAAVHLRKSPTGSSYGLVSKGATCEILGESGSWLNVKITSHTQNSPDLYGYTGWSKESFITRSSGSSSGSGSDSGSNLTYDDIYASGSPTYGTVNLNSGYLKVRALPSTSSNEVAKLYDGDSVIYYPDKLDSVGNDSNKWYKLTSPTKGFVASNYITATSSTQSSHPQTAEQAFGTSNLYEGCSSTYVRNLKLVLNNYYYYLDDSNSTFDAQTKRNVMEFQSDHHSELEEYEFQDVADGIVGPKTRALLWKYYGDKLSQQGYM